MARRVDESGETVDGGRGQDNGPHSLIGITKSKLKALLARCRNLQSDMDEARSTIGGLVSAACDKDHLHKGAFGVIRRLDKLDAIKRNEWLYHFDVMRDHMSWEQSDLLADRPSTNGRRGRASAEEGEGATA